MENTKLTKLEKYWILYDVGNSAFILFAITILPIYFSYLAEQAGISEVNYLAYWGYATSLATLLVAIIGPIVGTLADTKGYKKPIFTMSMMVGVLGCAALSVPRSWVIFLAMFVITKVGYSASLIFYDAMLVDVTSPERLDYVSSHGYAWGYIGSCIPFIISLVFVLFGETIGITMKGSMTIAFLLNAGWWFF
ncbi:MAG: MFS transporter, partial [Hungatella sp.]